MRIGVANENWRLLLLVLMRAPRVNKAVGMKDGKQGSAVEESARENVALPKASATGGEYWIELYVLRSLPTSRRALDTAQRAAQSTEQREISLQQIYVVLLSLTLAPQCPAFDYCLFAFTYMN